MKATSLTRSARFFGRLAVRAGLALLVSNAQAGPVQAGDWLLAQAQADGSMATLSDVATPFQATVEAVRALHVLGAGERAELAAAHQFVAAEAYHNSENLARKIIAGRLAGQDTSILVQELVASQDPGGGFGELAGFAPTPLDTAFALEALSVAGEVPEAVQRALGYLFSTQKSDGSWHAGRNEPSVYITALVTRAISHLRDLYSVESSLAAAQRFLLGRRHADGSWGEHFVTASVLIALVPHISDIGLLSGSAESLRAAQTPEGAWDASVFATALAVRALAAFAARENAAVGAGSGAVNGQVVRADGGQPLEGARIELGTGLSTETGADGRFLLAGVSPGTHTLLVTRVGYSGLNAVVSVADGEVTDAGQIALAGVSDAAMVLGRLADSVTGAPVEAARVTLSGAGTRAALSGVDGGFELSGVPAGDYELSFEKQGYHPVALPLTLNAGQTANVAQAMVREGAYLDSTPGDLSGRVLDGSTGEPLSGASFSLSDGRVARADADGRFLLPDVPRGSYTAALSASGYSTQAYRFSFEAGMSGDLGDLGLYPAAVEAVPSALTLHGRVLDGVSNAPLPGAAITLLSSGETAVADANGAFTVADLSETEFALEIAAAGYTTRTYSLTVSAYGEAASEFTLSPISSEPAATRTRLQGQITDAVSGDPVPGATVAIPALDLSATADASGAYVLSEIGALAFTLSMAAPGYEARSYAVELGAHGTYRLDGAMQAIDSALLPSVQVLSMVPVVGRGGADATLLFDAQVANVSDSPLEVLFAGTVFDGAGEAVGGITTYSPGIDEPASTFAFAPGETKTVRVAWQTAQHVPDTYRIVLRAVAPGSISRDQPHGVVLAEGAAYGIVEAERRFAGRLAFDPPLTQAGSQTAVGISALVLNTGNLPLPTDEYILTVHDASNTTELYRATATLDDLPVANHHTLDLGSWLPSAEGNLPVVLRPADPSVAGELKAELYVGDKAAGSFTVEPRIVPEGTQTVAARIAMQGVDTTQGSGTDPLFFAVREAVRKGGEFVASRSLDWHKRSRCLGCHIQTQSLAGLASSFDKAPIDKSAAKFLYNTLAGSQQQDGGLRISHPMYTRTQTALGAWALTAWPDAAGAFRTKYRAARHLYERRSQSGSRTRWRPDHVSGWWRSDEAQTFMVVKAYADLLRTAEETDLTEQSDYALQEVAALGDGSRPWDIEAGPDGLFYTVKAEGIVTRYDAALGTTETVATGLGIDARGIAIGGAGELYIAGTGGKVIRRNPDGSVDPVWTGSGTLMDIDIGPDGMLYVADYSGHRILRLSDDGSAEVIASGSMFRNPVGIAFGDDGALYVANRNRYNILRVELSGAVSVFAEGLAYPPMWLASSGEGGFYFTTDSYYSASQSTPRALNYLAADGTVERLNAAGGIAGVAVSGGRILIADHSRNSVHELSRAPLDTAMLDAYRLQLAYAANYFLAGYQDGTRDNIRQAARLMGLAEIRTVVTDAGLIAEVDKAVAYLDRLLRSRQRGDGGWGWYTYYGSDAMVTALVGLALEYSQPSADDPVIRSSIQYLLNQQGSDKAWRSYNGILSTKLAATSLVMAYMPKALERLGGIDVDLHLSLPSSVSLANAGIQPDQVTPDGAGNTEYLWRLTGVTADSRDVDFELTLEDLRLHESRAVANSAYIEFANSFTEERLQVALEVPAVKATSGLSLIVAADRDTYGANAPVAIATTVVNTGVGPTSGSVELAIRASGSADPLVWLDPLAVDTVDPGASRDLDTGWNTGTTFAGDYVVYGRIVDSEGRTLDEATDTLSIVHLSAPVASSLVTNQPVYRAWDQVEIAGRVRNAADNAMLAPSLAELTVQSPGGETLLANAYPIGQLQPQSYRDLPEALALSDAQPGRYPVKLVVKDAFSHSVLSVSETVFVVERTALQSLLSEVNVAPARVYQGDATVCTQALTNRSRSAVSGIAVDRQVVRVAGEELIHARSEAVSLSGGAGNVDVFSIATADLSLGEYACVLRAAVDGQSAYLGAAGFEVVEPPIRIDTALDFGPRGRVLVLMDGATPSGTPDRHGPAAAPSTEAQRAYLQGLLDEAGWSYTIVETAEAFARELNSGAYIAYALFAEHEKLSEQTQKALREAIYRGEGLLVGGRHDQRNGRLGPALGIDYRGKLPNAQGIGVTESELHPAETAAFALADKALRVEIAGAQVLGSFSGGTGAPENRAALTTYSYGEGRSLYVGYDLLAEAMIAGVDSLHARLILAGLGHVHPEQIEPLSGGVVPLRVRLLNEGTATPGRVLLHLPPGAEVVDAAAGFLDPDAAEPIWVWPYTLAEDESLELDLWLRLPADGRSVSVETVVRTGAAPEFEDHEALSIFIAPQVRQGLTAAIAALQGAKGKAYKPVLNALRLAQRALDGADYARALRHLLKATDRLMDISDPTAASARVMIDVAIWEVALSL